MTRRSYDRRESWFAAREADRHANDLAYHAVPCISSGGSGGGTGGTPAPTKLDKPPIEGPPSLAGPSLSSNMTIQFDTRIPSQLAGYRATKWKAYWIAAWPDITAIAEGYLYNSTTKSEFTRPKATTDNAGGTIARNRFNIAVNDPISGWVDIGFTVQHLAVTTAVNGVTYTDSDVSWFGWDRG